MESLSGKALGADYLRKIETYLEQADMLPVSRDGSLNVTAIAEKSGIPKQRIYMNPAIRLAIEQTKAALGVESWAERRANVAQSDGTADSDAGGQPRRIDEWYRLLRHIPSGVRLILVGDPSQLPPIGPGLVLHALAGLSSIPQTELKVVKRQSSASGIPQVAMAIRNHQAPTWADYSGKAGSGVSFVRCSPALLEGTVQQIYEELGGTGDDYSVQILSITNAGHGGVENLNAALHGRYGQKAGVVYCHNPEFGVVGATTLDREPLKVGDLVIYTENDYLLGLRNGSLGKIIATLPVDGPDDPCCVCDFEGTEYHLNCSQMNALKHSYSITVHKSQGSQFKRVVVPIRESRLLDQTLIYTAVTRGVDQVVMVGNEQAALKAIRAPASAARRHITLPLLLEGTVK